uniref:Hydroxysteroid dehydrogenase-like protein 2 n=1 Tax=Periophthalmus magnuspinnatus TaxID=409849 RepID=A0A3B3ZUR3_9GOBI
SLESSGSFHKLAGCTLFITGASRGIGKAIALKAARDGANVVIAAKTADPHPKLPGTIYTAAQEVEAAGGKALPCVVDIRDEQQIGDAVKKAVDTFGGIDILVNNASAISLTGTLDTPTKKVDLMLGINLRGTYLTSKLVLPHLLKSRGSPHILNLSPPLNLNPVWFKNHTGHPLLPDFFLDETPESLVQKMEEHAPPTSSGPIESTFDVIRASINEDVVKSTQGLYRFDLTGQHGGVWFLDLKSGSGSAGAGEPASKADVVMTMDSADFTKMFSGRLKPTLAFMSGKLKIKGDMTLAIKLEKLMTRMNQAKL